MHDTTHRSLVVKTEDHDILEFVDKQLKIFWLPDEIAVEKDVQDILVNMTDAERHGVLTTLKLFSLYEDFAGDEYWGGKFKTHYQENIAMTRMASAFSFFENCVHLPFYKKINELLSIDTDDFYNSYVDDPTLKSRMDFIGNIVSSDNHLYSLAAFSMIEGAVLYSSFAYLKHFQSRGKNKLLNVVRGINFSVRDENLHNLASAHIFKKEGGNTKIPKETIYEIAETILEHESVIVDKIFERGDIEGITSTQMKHFVESRLNLCLKQLGYPNLYKVTYNPISEWFYDGINGFQYNDFFAGIGNSYQRNWDESRFTWSTEEKYNG